MISSNKPDTLSLDKSSARASPFLRKQVKDSPGQNGGPKRNGAVANRYKLRQ
jgi:hypothetical protein